MVLCASLVFGLRPLVFGLWSSIFGLRPLVFGLWSLVVLLCLHLRHRSTPKTQDQRPKTKPPSTKNKVRLRMTLNFGDGRKWNLYDLTVWTEHLDTGRGEGLRGLHTANHTPDPSAVGSDDFDVVFSVERL
jgi:hypothetical protein